MLPGWMTSKGARLETFVGKALKGIPVYSYDKRHDVTGTLTVVPYIDLARAWVNIDTLSFNTPMGRVATL